MNDPRTDLPAPPYIDRPPTRDLLDRYRSHFSAIGTELPLRPIRPPASGLLTELPPAPLGRQGWPWTSQSPVTTPTAKSTALISIIVPSFNQGIYIEEALRSILLQNYSALELIVLDGGSTDETTAILQKYSPWLSFMRSGPDRGQGHAINLGLALASGNTVAWLNSDDVYFPQAFHRIAQAFAEDKTLEFVYGDGIYLAEAERKIYYSSAPLALDRYLHFGGLIYTHAAFWRHAISEPIWEALKCNVDGELWFRLLRGARRRHLPIPLGALRGQAEAKSVNQRWRECWREDDRLIWSVHGQPPVSGSWRNFEHRQVQRLYTAWNAKRWHTERYRSLAQTNWSVS